MIQQDEEWNKELGEHGKILDDSARIIERLSSEPKYNQLRTLDVLADIEQNIFRCPIRSLQYTGEATYYVFFSCDKHKIIKDAIVRRFGDYYKADVSYVENPLLLDLLNSLKSNKQYAKVLKFLDKQPIYSEFTTQDIMSDPEVNFTKDQFQNARKNRIVDYFLKQFKVNDHKKETTYKKMFDLRDVDKLLK